MRLTIRRLMMTGRALRVPGRLVQALMMVMLQALPMSASAQTPAVRYTMDPGSVPPASWVDGRAPGVVVTKARDGQPLCNGAAYETNWDGVVAWNDPLSFTGSMIPVKTSGRYFFRAKFRLDADVDRVDGAKLLRVGYPGGVTFELFDRTSTLKAQIGNVVVYWGGVPVTRTRCHKIEVAISPTGIRAWLDDVLLGTWTGNGNAGSDIYLMSNWSSNPGWEHDANNHVYWDDVQTYSDVAGHDAAAMWAGTIGEGSAPPPPPPPPAPVNCTGVWAESLSEPTPLVCDATQQQTRTRTRTFTVTTTESNGGTCAQRDQSPIRETETSPCVYVPPPPPPLPTLVGRFASQATYSSGGVSGLRVTLRVSAAQALPAVGAAVTLRVPLANGESEMRSGRVRSTRAQAYSGGDGQIVVELPGLNAIGLELQLPQ